MTSPRARSTETPYLPPGTPAPAPAGDGLDAPYWEAAQEERLLVQRCDGCGLHRWGPEWICHACLGFEAQWVEVEPRGRIYSWERVWHPVHPALTTGCPYVVVLVELPQADNVRMVGNLLGRPRTRSRSGRRWRRCSSTTATPSRRSRSCSGGAPSWANRRGRRRMSETLIYDKDYAASAPR